MIAGLPRDPSTRGELRDELRACLIAIDEVLAGLLAARGELRRGADPGAALMTAHARHVEPAARPLRGPVPPPALLDRVGLRFDLDAIERWILALAVAPDLDAAYGELFGALGGHAWRPVAIDLIEALAPWFGVDRSEVRRRLDPAARLTRWGLVAIARADSERPVLAAPAEVGRWLIHDARDPRYRTAPSDALDQLVLPRSAADEVSAAARWLRARWDQAPVIAVRGRAGTGRDAIAAALVAAAGRGWIVVTGGELADRAAAAAIGRDARWADAAVMVRAPIGGADLAPLAVPCVAIHDPDEAIAAGDRPQLLVGVGEPSRAHRRALWHRALPAARGPDLDPELLGSRYRFGPGRVVELVARAVELAAADPDPGPVTDRHVRAAVERSRRERSDSLARLLPVTVARQHLALDAATGRELDLAIQWIRRGASALAGAGPALAGSADGGVVCLFHGPSGTGKTMAAQVLGAAVGLDVLRVDISQVMSKYIGETEKHLDAVFRDAEDAGAILLFDEADAVFGRRTEVRSSNDRHANVETGFLLQRLEQHRGVVVLTTNLERNFDDAFLRRIHIRIELAMPGPIERAVIWRVHLPPGAAVDVETIAQRFALSGGEIRNAVMTALVLASRDDTGVDTARIAAAIWREQRKTGRLIDVESFRPWRGAIDAQAGVPVRRR